MEHPGFFDRAGPFTVAEVATHVGGEVSGTDQSLQLTDVRPLAEARGDHVSFVDNRKYLEALEKTSAGACFVAPAFANRVPPGTVAIVTKTPYQAFALSLQLFYPEAMRSKAAGAPLTEFVNGIHPTARIEEGAVIEPGAIIGKEAAIGRGTTIAAGAVIGYRVHIGRDSYVGPGASVIHSLVGDRVVLHAGVRAGQDGFGFAMSQRGHLKVPQIGRVIIQDDVEIGANSAIDRGALKDTIIGEGTKIDNLVQIGHNVVIGRHCVIVGQVGIAGSTELGDFVVMGGHAGAAGHIKIGSGAQIAGASHVKDDVPAGARMFGTPALPFRDHARAMAALARLARRPAKAGDDDIDK